MVVLLPSIHRLLRLSLAVAAIVTSRTQASPSSSHLRNDRIVHRAGSGGPTVLDRGHSGLKGAVSSAWSTCQTISQTLSNSSGIFYPGQAAYIAQTEHWCSNMNRASPCSVEPGTAEDVAAILKVLSRSKSSFSIRSGGHSCAPGFSGTKGVNIAMTRFNQVEYDSASQTASIGTGLIWDDVYAALEPHDVKVAGGRVTGVGVAGLALGGGFSWLTNEVGLTADTIVAYELVTPQGQILDVRADSHPDLFFGLKGGQANFGIVTKIVARTYPSATVWGGAITLNGTQVDPLLALIADFEMKNDDPKANILPTLNNIGGLRIISVQLFYDGPSPPSGSYASSFFNKLLALPALAQDVRTRSMTDYVRGSPANQTSGLRGVFATVSLETLTPQILNTIKGEYERNEELAKLGGAGFISFDVEPFIKRSSYPAANMTAWPRTRQLSPLNLYFAWPLGIRDETFYAAVRNTRDRIYAAALAQGQNLDGLYQYPNYALYDTPLSELYGPNVGRLTEIAARYDPERVMARAGGFLFQRGQNRYSLDSSP